jgi:DNA-binding SARP family transcriptional activator/TolB-like protein
MIRLGTLGVTTLTGPEGADVSAILRQPKRFALLCYLSLARPRGLHRRDQLLPLFWPELDTERGRAALRQSLYRLRQHLPSGVLVTRGDEEVGVDPGIWCDVRAFESALEAGHPEEALALYGGDLLDGFHVSDVAPEFEYWVEGERSRLRHLAASGAWELAERALAGGQRDDVREWATRAAGFAPLDEEAARRVVEMLDTVGDRAGALDVYEQWARRLREDLEVEPAPETVALVDSIRRRSEARPTEPQRNAMRGPAGPHLLPRETAADAHTVSPEATAPADIPGARGRFARWRSGGPLPWLALLGLVAIVVVVLPLEVRWRAGMSAPTTTRVVVLPFTVQGSPDLAYLSDGLVYLLSSGIDGEDVRAVDPHLLLRQVRDGVGSRSAVDGLAQRFGADYVVRGNAMGGGGEVRLSAAVYPREGGVAVGRATVTGDASELLSLVDQLTIELLTSWRGSAQSSVTQMAAIRTSSVPALKAYLLGERRLRQGRVEAALAAFHDAVREDTLFALAYYRMSIAGSWGFRGELATWAAGQALRHSDRLPMRERLLLEALSAYRAAAGAEAEQLALQLTGLYPEDPEGWYRLGETILHYGPPRGRPVEEAREPFMRAAVLDLLRPESLYHLVQISALAGDTAAALRYARQALAESPDGERAPQLLTLRAVLQPGRSDWAEAVAALASADDRTVLSAAYSVAVYAGNPARARDVARQMLAPSRPTDTRAYGHLMLASLELARGRWRAAREELRALRSINPGQADQGLALLGTVPGVPIGEQELRELQARLAGNRTLAPESGWWAVTPEVRWLPHWYSRVRVAVRLQDEADLESLLTELDSLATDSVLVADLAAGARSEFARARSDPLEEIPLPGPVRVRVELEQAVLTAAISQPSRRHLQATVLAARGQEREALAWFESLEAYSVNELPYGVPALLDRARILEFLGEREAARTLYDRLLGLWADADPEFEWLAREARAGLRRLTGIRDPRPAGSRP